MCLAKIQFSSNCYRWPPLKDYCMVQSNYLFKIYGMLKQDRMRLLRFRSIRDKLEENAIEVEGHQLFGFGGITGCDGFVDRLVVSH